MMTTRVRLGISLICETEAYCEVLAATRSGRHWGRPDDPGRRDLLSPVTPGGSLAMTFVSGVT